MDATVKNGSNRYESEYVSSKGKKIAVEISAKIIDEQKGLYQAIARDISARKKYEQKIKFRANFEQTIANISSRFIGHYDLDDSIAETIKEIAQFNHADHGHLMLLSESKEFVEKVYVYGDECVSSIFNGLEGKKASEISFLLDKLQNQSLLHLTENNSEVKADANLMAAFQSCSVKSAIIIPLKVNEEFSGMMSFHDVDSSDRFIEDEKQLLKICADVIGNALEQKYIERKIQVVNEQLKKADKVKSEFMKMTSRQLRQPLSMIKGYAQIVMSGSVGTVSEEQQKSLNVMLNNINRMNQTLSDIEDISNFDSGVITFHPSKINVKELVESVVDSQKNKAEEKNIEVKICYDDDSLNAEIDEKRISQVVKNLLDNAIKFSYENSSIEVNISKRDEDIFVEVLDHGKGLMQNEQEKIFDAFYQTDDVKENKYSGGGIGLSICKGIIDVHGGKIWVESSGEEQGTKFSFMLPTNWNETKSKKRLEEVDMFGLKSHGQETKKEVV